MIDTRLVAVTESFTISITLFGRHMGMTVLLAVLHVRAAVIIEVLAGSFDTIPESLAADLVEFIGSCVPRAIRGPHAPIWSAHHVRHGNVVTMPEAFAVGGPHRRRNIGMPVFIAVVDIGTAMIAKVFASAFHAIVEAAALHIVPCVGRAVPVIAILSES